MDTHEIDYVRQITVYVPAQYRPGTEAPFIVCHDGPKGKPNLTVPRILDNLIARKRVPVQIAIMVANGGGDAQGHQRGKEYDTMSGLFAEYIETEVLPLVEKNCRVQLTKDPDGRAVMGNSSGGSAALIMAWYRTDLYHRVLTTSGTFVNQQWPFDPKTPGGAWDFHKTIIPNSPKKPLRIFLAVGDRDNFNPNVMRDGMHDWLRPTIAWPRFSRPRATITSTCSAKLRPQCPKRGLSSCRTHWNGSGTDTPQEIAHATVLFLFSLTATAIAHAAKPNVLFVISDDLNTALSGLGHPECRRQPRRVCRDRFTFTRAFCQFPCADRRGRRSCPGSTR